MKNRSFDDGLMENMFSNAYKARKNRMELPKKEIIDDLTEEQALKVSNEILEVLMNNNLSYKNAYRISLAVTSALATGGVELYKNE